MVPTASLPIALTIALGESLVSPLTSLTARTISVLYLAFAVEATILGAVSPYANKTSLIYPGTPLRCDS